jgi:urease accessory protein
MELIMAMADMSMALMTTTITTTTIMTTEPGLASLVRLMTWLSPAFPVGGFAYSSGLESAVSNNLVSDAASLSNWLKTVLAHGSVWNDIVLAAEAWRNFDDKREIGELAALGLALSGTAERYLETSLQGRAFMEAASPWIGGDSDLTDMTLPYPVAVGAVAAGADVPLEATLTAYLHALASQAVSAAIRCSVIGQKKGVEILAGLERETTAIAQKAARSTRDDLGTASIIADIVSMRHETQETRLFRS